MTKRRNYKGYKVPINYSVSRAILDILLDLGESTTLFASPYQKMKRSFREIKGAPSPPKTWRYNRAIEYLKQREEIKLVEKNNKTFLKLTRKGKVRALMLRLYRDFAIQKEWDGRWRLILWDIPESSAEQRNNVRNLVKGLGFYQLQKSAFITPYPLPVSAVEYLKDSKLLRYIRFLRVDKLENDQVLKKHFQLHG